jgi:hypothetical protein
MALLFKRCAVVDELTISTRFLNYILRADSTGLTESEYGVFSDFDAKKAAAYPNSRWSIMDGLECVAPCAVLGVVTDCVTVRIIQVTFVPANREVY